VIPGDKPRSVFTRPALLSGGALSRIARKGKLPMPIEVRSSALTDRDVAELKARHLACSHLIKGSQDAIIRLRNRAAAAPVGADMVAAHRATEILEEVVGSWCETLSILRSVLNRTTSPNSLTRQRLELDQNVFNDESRRRGVESPDAGGS
jgi:hypothetical protein